MLLHYGSPWVLKRYVLVHTGVDSSARFSDGLVCSQTPGRYYPTTQREIGAYVCTTACENDIDSHTYFAFVEITSIP